MATKTDNANLEMKLQLRRYFIDKYHDTSKAPLRVFETCQGSGHIWNALKREYPLRVWGVDVKARKGRLMVDAHRVLAGGIGPVDIVDIDTYGEPWSMLELLLRKQSQPLTIFLTWGMPRIAMSASKASKVAINLPPSTPSALAAKAAWRLGMECCIGGSLAVSQFTCEEARAMRLERGGARVRYIGLRIIPAGKE